MSRPEPAAAAAGASATKMPAPTMEPSPMTTASKVPSLRCSAGPSGVSTARDATSGDGVFPECRFTTPNGGRHCNRNDEHNRPDHHQRNGPNPARQKRSLALVDVGVLAGGGRLAQIGRVSRPTFDLEPVLVKGIEKDRKIQCQQSDGDEADTHDPDVERAMVIVMQQGPPVQVMQTSAKSSTGHDTIDPRYDTTRLTPVICCRCSVCVLDQTAPTIR